jgi:UDP-galactopyranose mutase
MLLDLVIVQDTLWYKSMKKAKIIGCGLSGIVSAILLKDKGYDVEIFDTRDHIGGNCYDEKINNITVHKYGLHVFHTNDTIVWNFLNRYSSFNNYIHKARANTRLGLISIPYNLKTRDQLGKDLSLEEIQDLIFKDYSERHWGIKWKDLPKSISGRLPSKRDNYDDRYFTDKYQGIPSLGYSHMLNNMLDGIKVNLSIIPSYYKKILNDNHFDLMIYTGKPDDYFDYTYGRLEYRSLRFEHYIEKINNTYSFESGGTINECNKSPFNRTTDNRIFLNETPIDNNTVYTRDYPEEHNDTNDPFYPKNFGDNIKIFEKYNQLIRNQNKVVFIGRLATYKYLDMWMAIKQVFNKISD